MKTFIKELQRRNVIKAAISYAVFSWLLIQVASILYPSLGWGQNAITNTLITLIICFPLWIIFAYIFEWTASGFKKTNDVAQEHSISKSTSKKLNAIIIAGLSLAVLLLAADRIFNFTGASETKQSLTAVDKSDKSIAVLAFADMSQEKDQEYFSDGISEEILNLLVKIPDLKVISRTSSFSFKGKEATTTEIGKTLNVGHILEGSIRKSGNTIRITAQLIKVSDGAHVWSETYDRDMTDILKIQDEIAGKVTQELKVSLLGEAIISKNVDPEAYNLYLQAKQVRSQQTEESLKNSKLLLRQSIALDSTFAQAWEELSGIVYSEAFIYLLIPMEEGITIGTTYAQKAITLDPSYANAYARLAYYQRYSWDFKEANATMEKAVALGPDNADVIKAAADNALNFGKKKEAIVLQLKALELDPLDYYKYYRMALLYYYDKQYDKAAGDIQSFLLHYPNAAVARSFYALILLGQGDKSQAFLEVEKEPDAFWKIYSKCMLVYSTGKTEEANALLKQLVKVYGEDSWPNIAHVYAFRGEKDEAFKWLNLAFDNKDGSLLEILDYPEMKNLWGDPRWNKFINKLGLPADHGFHRD
ncbi:MAG: hypothetical protein ABIO60_00680 [Aquaticitalea sp.]